VTKRPRRELAKRKSKADPKSKHTELGETRTLIGGGGRAGIIQALEAIGAITLTAFGILIFTSYKTLAVLSLFVALISSLMAVYLIWQFSRSIFIILVASVLTGCVALQVWVWHRAKPVPQTFSFEPELLAIRPQRFPEGLVGGGWFWLVHNRPNRPTASPVSVVAFLRIVNLQNVQSTLDWYSLEIEIGTNDWRKLIHMDARLGKVLWQLEVDKEFKDMLEVNLSENGLDYLLSDRAIPPHGTVRGFAFFEIPGTYNINETKNFRLRIHIKDTAGVEFEGIMPTHITDPLSGIPHTDTKQPIRIHTSGRLYDISTLPKKYFSEASPD